jgi:DNA-binding HxlR family transcriptional regulator
VRELLRAPRRYGELLEALPGIGTNLLVNRLRDLEDAGVVARVLAPAPQSAVVYALTDRGRALESTVDALQAWGEAHSDASDRRSSGSRDPSHAARRASTRARATGATSARVSEARGASCRC